MDDRASAIATEDSRTVTTQSVDEEATRRRRRAGWWVAGLGLPTLAVLGSLWAVPRIEDDLTAKTKDTLATQLPELDVGAVAIDFSGEDATVSGPFDEATGEKIRLILLDKDMVDDIHRVKITATGAPEPAAAATGAETAVAATSPVAVKADVADGKVTLSGSVPSDAEKTILLDAANAAYGDANVIDELTVDGATATADGTIGVGSLAALMASLPTSLVTGNVGLDEKTLTISGEAPDQAGADALAAAAAAEQSASGAVISADVSAAAPATSAVAVKANVAEGGKVTLTGSVPSDAEKAAIVDAAVATFGEGNVDDQLTVDGATATPDGTIGVGSFAALMPLLKTSLASGTVSLDEKTIIVSGAGVDKPAVDALVAAATAETSASGATVTTSAIAVPEAAPVAVSISTTGDIAGGRITLIGTVPTKAAKAKIIAAADASYGAGAYDDRITVAGGSLTPEGESGLNGLIQLMPALNEEVVSGTITVADGTLDLTATTADDASSARLKAALAALAGVTATDNVTLASPPKAADLEGALNKLVGIRPVLFESGSAVVLPSNKKLLDNLARQIRRAKGLSINVDGHTDSQGDPASNKSLSERRSAAVVAELIKRGVKRGQLKSRGFGEERPTTTNATETGRQKNRRVVFSVRKA